MAQYYNRGNKKDRAKIADKYGMKVRERRSGESELQYYRSLAKQADQRLRRLEDYANQKGFENVTKWAYADAMSDIHEKNPMANRFDQLSMIFKNEKGELDINSLRGATNRVKAFLESPSSTKRGIQKVYLKRANTVNEKYGTHFSWEEIGQYFDRSVFEKYDKQLKESGIAIRVMGIMKKAQKLNPEQLSEFIDKDKHISDQDEVVREIARDLLKHGLTYDTMMNS